VIIGDRTLPLNPDEHGQSTLHLWIDGSVIEVFVDSAQVMTVRAYALGDASQDIHVKWFGAAASLIELMISDIMPTSPNRMTT
jgi:hypothetical protein